MADPPLHIDVNRRRPSQRTAATAERSEPEDGNAEVHPDVSRSRGMLAIFRETISTRFGSGSKDAAILMAKRIKGIINGVLVVIKNAMISDEPKREDGDDVHREDGVAKKITEDEAKPDSNLFRVALVLVGICIGLGIATVGPNYCQLTIGNYNFGRFIGYDGIAHVSFDGHEETSANVPPPDEGGERIRQERLSRPPYSVSETPPDDCKIFTDINAFFSSSLRKNFPPQSDRFWAIVQASIRSSVRDHRPSCIVLPAHQKDPEAYKAVTALSRRLECAFTGSSDILVLQGPTYLEPRGRARLDEELSPWFDSGKRVAIINNIDGFNVETANAFYKFCDDNEGPRYPNTVLLLTVPYDADDCRAERERLEKKPSDWLSRRLRQKWSNDSDIIDPILSRVAGNVAVIHY